MILSTGSNVFHDFFVENETLATIHITDYGYETITALIEYLHTGRV